MFAVGLVLLIACGNIANLQLARGTTRQAELSVRAALGAGRFRLVRQLLTESLVLAIAAGALGVLLAIGLQDAVFRTVATSFSFNPDETGANTAMLLFAAVISLAASVLFGTLPALRMTPGNLAGGFGSSARAGAAPVGARLRSVLVIAQVALSVTLLIGSGLLLRSFATLSAVDPGFDASNLLTAEVALSPADYPVESRPQFFAQLTEAMRAVPGVLAVGAISQLPIVNPGNNIYVYDSRHPQENPAQMQTAMTRVVLPGYFETMDIPLVAGRQLELSEAIDAVPVMVINQAMADSLFAGENPVGKQVVIDSDDPVAYTVVGVVGNVRMGGLASNPRPSMYQPYPQQRLSRMRIAVRFAGDPAAVTPALREALWQLDPNIPIELSTMDSVISRSGAIAQSRLFAAGLTVFAAVALLLASIGLYGMLAFYVNLRRREIGVRMALGAQRGNVVTMVLRHGLTLAGIGVVLGVVVALLGTRLIEQQLHGITATDPLTFSAVVAFFGLVATIACLLPASRATRVEPVTVLRED